ncbi:MAG: hypothetical protein ORN20_06875, partial [Candidatus Nanopelagicales bacterium]|nr:hypothetical protein [Candidatus Nanopelagicales bacterium]
MTLSRLRIVVSAAIGLALVGGTLLLSTQSSAAPSATPSPSASAAIPGKFSIALIGDMPYDALGAAQVPNIFGGINKSNVAFTLFDGDTMSGKGDKCTDAQYAAVKNNFFMQFTKPVFYSIGDNEWVDCDRPVKGAYSPNDRLA